MANTERQNRLLLAEDWKRIYQSFKYADFQSYDFDNLRRTMINYIRQNYPEDFNDYIESSEYLALIDLIAFLGQNLAFRTDLNARENFIETAERRESVLRLARLLSYNPKRNIPANGLLKLESVSTTEDIIDSNGVNLANQTVLWNDNTNSNWFEQFVKILNAGLPVNNTFGRPVKRSNIQGVNTEQYRFNGANQNLAVYNFSKSIDSVSTTFEVVSANFDDAIIFEEDPFPGNQLAFLYRDDGRGSGSNNTGFFFHFRQGTIQSNTFEVNSASPNTVVNIDTNNINNSDLWLYKLDSNNFETELWTKVDSVEGNNIIYNSIDRNIRNIYSVLSRINDKISLIFSDGTFGELPKGKFKVYYRTSANRNYKITPDNLFGINVQIPYISRNGKRETLNLILELKETVENASTSEDNDSIKANAPATYYTQNRLITGEDYNVGTLGVSQEIVKAKAVNRTSSGISRYFDLRDATGKYSNTLIFSDDGVIYKESIEDIKSFEFSSKNDIQFVIRNVVEPLIKDDRTKNFYYEQFPRNKEISNLGISWVQTTADTNRSTGYFADENELPVTVGSFTQSILKFIEPGSFLKFTAPSGSHFMPDGTLMSGPATHVGSRTYVWTKVVSIDDTGTEVNVDTGLGPIVLNDVIPQTSLLEEIIPVFNNQISADVTRQMIDQVFAFKTFGLRYDYNQRQWRVIFNNNLNTVGNFSLGKQGDGSNQQLDSSWILLFETDGEVYTVKSRGLRYIFESNDQTRFFFDSKDKIYNSKTGKIVNDTIKVLSNNNRPNSLDAFTVDWIWQISKEFENQAGYIDSKKVEIAFFDSDADGVVDDPDLFTQIVDSENIPQTDRYIFQKKSFLNKTEIYNYVDADKENIVPILTESNAQPFSNYNNGTVFYIIDKDIFKKLNSEKQQLNLVTDYKAFVGRELLKFEYSHAADENARIDPSSSNLIDVYLLTRQYDIAFRNYLQNRTSQKPLPPSNDQLFLSYGSEIEKIKSISDDLIYHPVKYKPLFGSKSNVDLQAVFKVVKNPDRVVNDNDVKSRIITGINQYFSLDNWDFGETFYFSELAAYLFNSLAPDIVSIVLVPRDETQSFGSLYEIKSENDEIFVSSAIVSDVEIIDSITASRLRASGAVVTESADLNTGIQSSEAGTNIIITDSTGGGISY